jgi:hypothetical protein
MSLLHRFQLKAITSGVLLFASHLSLADDLKVFQLEQDVRDLRVEMQQQARRIETLEAQLSQSRSGTLTMPKGSVGRAKPPADISAPWLTISNWDRIRAGTPELDVIGALGPPTAVRKAEGSKQTLLYSLEIAAGGFLSGQVVLEDHKVVDVQKPTLK